MRLIELGCDQPSFHTLTFNRHGLTIVVGDGSLDKSKEGSSNGVGKTLVLGLVHHCLGANADSRLKAAVPSWKFYLKIEVDSREHIIERTGDGKKILVDGRKMSVSKLRAWLDQSGAFYLDPSVPILSFRSLLKRFARYSREDCLDPVKTNKEPDFDARLRTLYLFGLDCSLAVSKRKQKLELDNLAKTLQNWHSDSVLRDVFRAGTQPKMRAEWLDREIPRLKADRDRFQVAEDYREIESQAGEMTARLRDIERSEAILQFQQRNIDKALEQHPDISKQDLLELYGGLEAIFRPETLAHFDAVENFHNTLSVNRRTRLERDKAGLAASARDLEIERERVAGRRDRILQLLQGKRALDEYAALAQRIANLEEERQRIAEYLNLSTTFQEQAQRIKERRVQEDRDAATYIAGNPQVELDREFRSVAETLYPHAPAGIVVENNTGENQIRYNIAVQIEGHDSDGINAARILCLDWVMLMHGSNHTMDFVWHDNRLFADIDPKVRAAWFTFVISSIARTGKQYIASLNTENFDTMKEFMVPEVMSTVTGAVRLTLRGDRPENKLLGIQFGGAS